MQAYLKNEPPMELVRNNAGSARYLEEAAPASVRLTIMRPARVQIERELEVLARLMDNQFAIPVLGWRFGLNAIIDLIPGIGDVSTSLIALYILISAVRYRVRKITLLRMGVNVAIYFIAGMIPWAGDLFDAWWKPNIRNLKLLYARAAVSAAEARKGRTSDWLFVGLIVGSLLLLLCGSVALSALIIWYLFRTVNLQ